MIYMIDDGWDDAIFFDIERHAAAAKVADISRAGLILYI